MKYVHETLEMQCVSVRAFCRMIKLDRTGYYKLLKGEHKPSPRTQRKLAKGLEKISGIDFLIHVKGIKSSL